MKPIYSLVIFSTSVPALMSKFVLFYFKIVKVSWLEHSFGFIFEFKLGIRDVGGGVFLARLPLLGGASLHWQGFNFLQEFAGHHEVHFQVHVGHHIVFKCVGREYFFVKYLIAAQLGYQLVDVLLAPIGEHSLNVAGVESALYSVRLVLELFINFTLAHHDNLILTQVLLRFFDFHHEVNELPCLIHAFNLEELQPSLAIVTGLAAFRGVEVLLAQILELELPSAGILIFAVPNHVR